MGLEYRGVDELTAALNKVLDSREGLRRKFHERIADIAKEAVDSNINATINDSNSKIRNWQERVVGSSGGYAAVRPIKGSGKNSPGAITSYLERGHAIRRPSGKAKRARRRRIKVVYVDGRHFYDAAKREVKQKALAVAEQYANEIASILNGGGPK
jgi:hypothetical protein